MYQSFCDQGLLVSLLLTEVEKIIAVIKQTKSYSTEWSVCSVLEMNELL